MVSGLKQPGLVLWLLCVFLLAGCVRVPEPAAPGFTQNINRTTVALRLLQTSDRAVLPLVPVKLGKQTYWWLLDTGSSHNLIAEGVAEQLSLSAVASSEMASIGGRRLSMHYRLPGLQIGTLQLEKQSATALDLSHLSAPGVVVSGILGVPALRQLQVALDIPARRLTLANALPAAVLQPTVASVPFQLRGGVPVARVKIDGRDADVLLDSGNATSLVLLPAFTRFSVASQFSFIETRDLGGSIPARLARVSQLQLGNKVFADIQVSLPLRNHRYRRSAVAGSLGNGLLGQQRVVFDFPGQRLLIAGSRSNNVAGAVSGGFGFRLAQSNMIEVVLPDSPAQRSGIQVGERIVAVDGQATASAYEIWSRLNTRRQALLTVQLDDQVRQLLLRRENFLPTLN